MAKVLFIKPTNSSFIQVDEKILQSHFDVRSFAVNQKKGIIYFLWRLFRMKCFMIKNIGSSKAVIIWFADYHAAVATIIARVFKKKVILFLGGYDTICYKEFQKGVFCKTFRGRCAKYALRNAYLIIPNHASLIYHENYYYNKQSPHVDGIKHYVKGLKTKINVIHNGIDGNKFRRDPLVSKNPNMILTVGTMNLLGDFYNKGFDLFIEVARENPQLEFVLIYIKEANLPWLEANYHLSTIKNLKYIVNLASFKELLHYYNQASVYVQASISEGMPNALAEAMLCECVPVGSNVNGIPDCIGDCGVIVETRDKEKLNEAIQKALKLNSGKKASMRIREQFNLGRREKELISSVNQLLK